MSRKLSLQPEVCNSRLLLHVGTTAHVFLNQTVVEIQLWLWLTRVGACPLSHGRRSGWVAPCTKDMRSVGGHHAQHHGVADIGGGHVARVTHEVAVLKYLVLSVSKASDQGVNGLLYKTRVIHVSVR